MKKQICILVAVFFNMIQPTHSQNLPPGGPGMGSQRFNGVITGTIYDRVQDTPIEYANIILFNQRDSSQVTGTISDPKGFFQITGNRPGRFYLEIRFMGYTMKRSAEIRLTPSVPAADLGRIELERTVLDMQSVSVAAERPALTYEIDKKVVNVSQMKSALSGTAADVLENVPSVTVDVQGNVTLRGSSNFMVLIDGRPTVLEPNDALQQTPASTIENIEIITNPSAKYDPDGTAGIINLVLKKGEGLGRSGLVNLNGGANDKYGGDFLYEVKTQALKLLMGLDYNRRYFGGTEIERNETVHQGLASYIHKNGDSRRGRTSFGLRSAIELRFSPKDIFSFDGRYGKRSSRENANLNYNEWSGTSPEPAFYTSTNTEARSGTFYALNMSYQRSFARKGHELSAQLLYNKRESDESSTDALLDPQAALISGRRSTESGPADEFRTKLDYILPIGSASRFEAGYQGQYNQSTDLTGLYEYHPDQQQYVFIPDFSHRTHYDHNIHSAYTIFSSKRKQFGFQGGLRGESTDRWIELLGTKQIFTINRWDYFPTLHLSYQFSDERQVMASYTRRIERPRGYFLEPFLTWMDAYNARIGNPDLKPEYIDSYEMGYQTSFGRNLISVEGYYRINHNKVDQIRSVYAANISLHTVDNVGTDYALGSELMMNLDLTRKWNINLMGNLYNYRIEGMLYNAPFARESFNWSTRLNNVFKLGRSTQIQINGRYNSPTVSSQGRREGFFTTDLALNQEFLARTVSLTLQIRDLFKQAKHEYSSEGPDFYLYNLHSHESPIVMLNFRYNINDYKPDRKRNGNGEEGGSEDF